VSGLTVRLGEWDFRNTNEPLPTQDFNVTKIFIHPQFNYANSKNNIAIVRLATPVNLGELPTIGVGCLPCE
jgi:Trypsin